MKLYKIAWRNISRNRRRSLLSVSAITVASMAIVFLFSLLAGMKVDMARNLTTYYTGHVRIKNSLFEKYEKLNPLHLRVKDADSLVEKLEDQPGVKAVSPRISFPVMIDRKGETTGALAQGLSMEREQGFQDIGSSVTAGRLPREGALETLMGSGLAEELGLGVGDTITFLTQTMTRRTNGITLEVVGISSFPEPGMNGKYFFMPLGVTQQFLWMDGAVSEILVLLDEESRAREAAAQFNQLPLLKEQENVEAAAWTDLGTFYSFIEIAAQIYNVMAFVFFLLGSTVVITTTMMVIYERMREIGTVAAMGMTGGQIVGLFFLEAFYLGVIGSGIGVILGIGITQVFAVVGLDFSAAMEGVSMEVSSVIYPQLNLKSTLGVFVYSAAVASLATYLPSRKAARIEPVEALRSY